MGGLREGGEGTRKQAEKKWGWWIFSFPLLSSSCGFSLLCGCRGCEVCMRGGCRVVWDGYDSGSELVVTVQGRVRFIGGCARMYCWSDVER